MPNERRHDLMIVASVVSTYGRVRFNAAGSIPVAAIATTAATVAATVTATAATAAEATVTTAATTAAAVATTATAAATTVAAATTATATGAIFTRLGLVDGQGAAMMILPIESSNRGLGFFFRTHLDKTEPL
jgi:hypothetical protein